MIKIIQQWLAKPSGRYFDGLAIFTQLASADIKKKYLEYFNQVKTEPKQHDVHFCMLINKVSAIAQNIQVNPKLFENIELVLKETGPDADTLKAIEEKTCQINALKAKIESLKSENEDILDENLDLSDQVEELESDLETAQGEISEYEEKLEELEKELIELKAKRGIQIRAIKDMPENLQKGYARVQEITPLMGKLHAEISVEGISQKSRAKLVKQLCALDDERRQNWDAINDWSEGKTVELTEVKEEPGYDADPLVAGAQMLRRIDRLTENIKRSQDVADATDKETIKANALKRIEAYNVELEELKVKLPLLKLKEVLLNNEMFDQLFPGIDSSGTVEPLIHKGEWAIHDVLPILLNRIGPAEVKIATFSISEDSLRPLFFLVESGMITKLTLLLDATVKRHKLDMLLFALNITPSIRIENNHSKLLLVSNDTRAFGIVGSANLNQPRRIEAGVYFTAGKFFNFYTNAFDNYFTEAIPYELD